VDQARGHFLAGARFAGDVHRRLRARELRDHLARALDRGRFAEEPRRARGTSPMEARRACTGRGELERAHHQRPQLLELDGLREVVEGARLERGHRVLGRAERRDHRDRRIAVVLRDVAQDRDAVAVRQAHVGEAEVVGAFLQRLLGFLHRRRSRRHPRPCARA
jgi:hypothetical protein